MGQINIEKYRMMLVKPQTTSKLAIYTKIVRQCLYGVLNRWIRVNNVCIVLTYLTLA